MLKNPVMRAVRSSIQGKGREVHAMYLTPSLAILSLLGVDVNHMVIEYCLISNV